MKVIDLLNKIANGEKIPESIMYNGTLYEYNEDIDYETQYGGFLMGNAVCICPEDLNEEVEIIEEPQEHKIPEKLYHCCMETNNEEIKFLIKNINDISDKINEILKYLEELK